MHLAKLKKEGATFEISIDSDKAVAYKKGEISDISDVLEVENIFSDAKKGLQASKERLISIFKTDDPLEVAKIIIEEGDVQLTSEHRQKEIELKKKQLVDMIHRNAVDPKTHLPHPTTRIEAALDQAKVHVDEKKTASDQLQEVIKALRPILPIKFEVKEMEIHIPAATAAKTYGQVKTLGKVLKEDWLNDGSLSVVLEIPGGLETELYDKVGALTHGEGTAKVLTTR